MTSSTIDNLTQQQWHKQSAADAQKYLRTDLEAGLSEAEVSERQKLYGFNEIKGKAGKSPIIRFLMEFNRDAAAKGLGRWGRNSGRDVH